MFIFRQKNNRFKKIIFNLIFGIFLSTSLLQPLSVAEARTTKSWEGFGKLVSRNNIGCPSGYSARSFIFLDRNKNKISTSHIQDVKIITIPRLKSYKVLRSINVGAVNPTPSVCFLSSERVIPIITFKSSSPYEAPNIYSGYLLKKFLIFKSWPEKNKHFRYEVFIGKKSDSPDIRLVSPYNIITNKKVQTLRARVNKIGKYYGASKIAVSNFYVSRNNLSPGGGIKKTTLERGIFTLLFGWGNGTGVRSYKTPPLNDGLQYWWYTAQGTGSKTFSCGFLCWIIARLLPLGSLPSHPSPFLVDTAAPSTSVSATVGNSVGTKVGVTVVNKVKDTLSGLKSTVIYISATDKSFSATIPLSFNVGSGVTGGPKSAQTITIPLTLSAGKTYTYYAVTTDAAGNKKTSTKQTFTTPKATTTPSVGLKASPVTVPYNGSSDLTWLTSNVLNCFASSNPVTTWSGPRPVTTKGMTEKVSGLQSDTVFTISCSDSNGNSISDSATVKVGPKPTVDIDANPLTVNYNGSTDISWIVSGVKNCTASSNPATTWNGTRSASTIKVSEVVNGLLNDTAFALSCDDTLGNKVSDVVNVKVIQPNPPTISVDKPIIRNGNTVTVNWDPGTLVAVGCTLSSNLSGNANQTGSDTVSPAVTTTYSIDCPHGSASVEVQVIRTIEET